MIIFVEYRNHAFFFYDENHNFLESCDYNELFNVIAEYCAKGFYVQKK